MDTPDVAADASAMDLEVGDPEALAELAASARGWHSIQLAVLGFIGFCGIFWDGNDAAAPGWLQWLPGILVVLALLLALMAIYLVGRVAYPFRGPAQTAPEEIRGAVGTRRRRLRTGIALTYVAMTALVVATLSGWFPTTTEGDPEAAAAVVMDVEGRSWCGELADAPGDELRLVTAEGEVTLSPQRLALVHPVAVC